MGAHDPASPERPTAHLPVLPGPLQHLLTVDPGGVVVDATVGYGGHAALLADQLDATGTLIGLDVDEASLQAARERLAGVVCTVRLYQANFSELDTVLDEAGKPYADVILADLGVCSAQLDDPRRGLSFQAEGPLDMRLDRRRELTAETLVNELGETDLADLLYRYGEERKSRRVARAVVEARRQGRISTTTRLAEIVCRALGMAARNRPSKIHPATRTFQALRIAVNEELNCLERLLEIAAARLAPDGRVAVISFHSLEDRIVKYDFRARAATGAYEILTRKPVMADDEEKRHNPRSRSAKLRVARRTTAGTATGPKEWTHG